MTRLWAPSEYWILTEAQIDDLVGPGGCGPGETGDYFVPDRLLGCNIRPCCRIHDFCYHIGKTIEDKQKADRGFLNNMLRMIREGSPALFWPRRFLAAIYYLAVHLGGGPAFWHGKNPPEEEGEIL